MKITSFLAVLAVSATTLAAWADPVATTKNLIPSHAIVLHGDVSNADSSVIAVFYSRENLDFSDAGAPRFLLLDRQGKVAFGIGGSLYATASYDFDGAIDSPDFETYNISVPANPAMRNRFGADVGNSSIFAKLVGKTSKYGIFSVYFQAKFARSNGAYGFRLKQAYATLGHLTAGLTTSTFVDADAQAPTIDPQGDCGQISDKSILFRYTTPTYRGLRGAISIEQPSATYSFADGVNGDPTAQKIAQRMPDIPAYIQYAWKGGHVRLAGILRNLSYRNLVDPTDGKNHLATCWGLKFSTTFNAGMLAPFGHVSYGKGIATFVNDLSGNGYDLVPDANTPGRLTPPASLTWTAGTYLNFSQKFFATTSFSRAQSYDTAVLGQDSYRYAMYLAANAFYNFDSTFRIGAEYLRGWRYNYDGSSAHANRINLLLQYSF